MLSISLFPIKKGPQKKKKAYLQFPIPVFSFFLEPSSFELLFSSSTETALVKANNNHHFTMSKI